MVIEKCFKYFIPHNIDKEDIKLSYCKNFIGAGLIACVASPIYAIIYYFLGFIEASIVIMLAGIIMLGSLFILKYTQSLIYASTIFVLTFTILIVWLSYYLGGIYSPTAYWLTISPLLASYFSGIRIGYLWCIVIVSLITVLYAATYMHVSFPAQPVSDLILLQYFALIGMTLTLVILVYFYDLSKKSGYEKLRELAYQDSLTKISNRKAYEGLLKQAIENAKKHNTIFYILYLDIDHFKKVNSIFGNHIADLLLTEVVHRIKICIRHTDTMARVGGDEFKIIIENIKNINELNDIANILLKSFEVPFNIRNHEVKITMSIGIVTNSGIENFDYKYIDQYSEIALSKAKNLGGNNLQYYNDTLASENALRIEIEHQLPDAIKNNELSLFYQMQYDANQIKRITGFEVLLRWNNPKHGDIPSNIFIPIAEKAGIISQIGKWVVHESCIQYMRWKREGLVENIPIAINISAYQLYGESIIKFLENILSETGISANDLELELTETAIITDPVYIIHILQSINNLGIQTVIDDFGSGYTSLGYLSLFPISGLKIDKLFLDNMLDKSNTSLIIESIIDLAHKINLKVVVEGIENIDQLTYLQNIKCDYVQGFYLCKPLDVASTTALLRSYKTQNNI